MPIALHNMPTRRVVVMGVSGCGKSTVGQLLAQALGWDFVEGDHLHSAQNVHKMASGQALTDEDRAGWLASLAQVLGQARAQGHGVVLSCSALKRAYRDRLRQGDPSTVFVHLWAEPAVIAQRLAQRVGHYMPASLLQSQLADLQVPQADEAVLSMQAQHKPQTLVAHIVQQLQTPSSNQPLPDLPISA